MSDVEFTVENAEDGRIRVVSNDIKHGAKLQIHGYSRRYCVEKLELAIDAGRKGDFGTFRSLCDQYNIVEVVDSKLSDIDEAIVSNITCDPVPGVPIDWDAANRPDGIANQAGDPSC